MTLILESAKGGITRGNLIWKIKTNDTQVKKYVIDLLDKGLLEYEVKSHRRLLKTTAKGLRVLSFRYEAAKLLGTGDKDDKCV